MWGTFCIQRLPDLKKYSIKTANRIAIYWIEFYGCFYICIKMKIVGLNVLTWLYLLFWYSSIYETRRDSTLFSIFSLADLFSYIFLKPYELSSLWRHMIFFVTLIDINMDCFFKFHINNKFAHNLPIINKSTFIYSSQSQKQLSIIGYFREIT